MDTSDELFNQMVIPAKSGSEDDIVKSCEAIRRFITFEVSSGSSDSSENKRRFYMIYSRLLDRIFGEDECAKLKQGGWMTSSTSYVSPVRRASFQRSFGSSPPTSFPATNKDHLSPEGAALVQLLGAREAGGGSLFSLLWAIAHPVEFALDIKLLPSPTQLEMTTRSASIPLLYTHLLHKPLNRQVIDPRSPSIMLTMAEYYLFYFLHYPVSRTRQGSPSQLKSSALCPYDDTGLSPLRSGSTSSYPRRTWSTFRASGILQLTHGSPYAVLLLQYLTFLLPNEGTKPKLQSFLASTTGRHYANSFLHMLVELWLHQNSVMNTTQGSVAASPLQSVGRGGGGGGGAPLQHDANMSFPSATLPVYTMGEYIEPTSDALHVLLITVIYLLNDAALPLCMSVDMAPQTASSGLTDRLVVLQSRLFQFFQIVATRCQIRVSPTTFFSVVDVWLALVQPWKCQEAYGRGISSSAKTAGASSSSSSSSRTNSSYTCEWESYVLSNYHMYTSLLALIIQRLGELDYTGNDGEAYVRMVYRVLQVYNRDLLALLYSASDILNEAEESMKRKMPIKLETEPEPGPSSRTAQQFQLLRNHCFTVGVKLEPIYFTASRRSAGRLVEQIRWVLSSKCSDATRDLAKDILALTGEIFDIADTNATTFSVGPTGLSKRNGPMSPTGPERDQNRNYALSDTGRAQIQTGLRMCSVDEASYVGDPMLQPVRSFEFEFMVYLTVWLSQRLNAALGFGRQYDAWQRQRQQQFLRRTKMGDIDFTTPPPLEFRFNLRCLAIKLVVYSLLIVLVPTVLLCLWYYL